MSKDKKMDHHPFADKPHGEVKTYTKGRAIAILSVISAVFCVLTVIGFIWIKMKFSDTNAVRDLVDRSPVLAAIVMALICAAQVVVAFVPGELVEISAGYAFGGFWGLVICMVGITLGSVVAILLARSFGRRLVESLYPREKIDALPILNDPSKRNTITFLLFLIPGTPKDLFTYVVGLTDMSIPTYILLTLFARIPSIVMSTIGGDALGDDKFIRAAIIFIIAAAVSGAGYLVYLWIQGRNKKK